VLAAAHSVRMRARGAHSSAIQPPARRDKHEYERLLDALTINVTKFWRNADTWKALAEPYVAQRWAARQGRLSVWSAGCASGEEPYTIAVVLAEAARAARQPDWLGRRTSTRPTSTRPVSSAPAPAQYPRDGVRRNAARAQVPVFHRAVRPHEPLPAIRGAVSVIKHDIAARERAPQCALRLDRLPQRRESTSNRPTQERLFTLFTDALVADGNPGVGQVETLFGPARDRLKLEDPLRTDLPEDRVKEVIVRVADWRERHDA